MSATGRTTAALGALLLAACAGPATEPSFVVDGTGIVVRSSASFAQRPDLPARLESTVEAALAYWGGGWSDLQGRTITLDGADHVACPGVASATGCFDGDIRVSTSDLGTPFSCVEQTSLVHEIGHAVIGDADHTDPRWMDFEPVAERLGGRIGYLGGSEVPCQIYPSVWRHPLASR
jgi:hypothetical protein